MVISDNTFGRIDIIASQIEGVTCALVTYLENVISEVISHEYLPFNRYVNEIRQLEIESIRQIFELYSEDGGVASTVYAMADAVASSEESLYRLKRKTIEVQDILQRLVTNSQNLHEAYGVAKNVDIPNVDSEFFSLLNGYNGLIEQYDISIECDEDDYVLLLFSNFYKSTMHIFRELNKAYDQCFAKLVEVVKQRQEELKKPKIPIKKINKISGDLVGMGLNTALVGKAILSGDVLKATEKAVDIVGGLTDVIRDNVEPIREKSGANGMLGFAGKFFSSMDIAEELGADNVVDKGIMAMILLNQNMDENAPLSDKEHYENLAHGLGLVGDSAKAIMYLLNPIKTPVNTAKAIANVVSFTKHGVGLINALNEVVHSDEPPKTTNSIINALWRKDKEIAEHVEKIKYEHHLAHVKYEDKVARGIPVRRPPPDAYSAFRICEKLSNALNKGFSSLISVANTAISHAKKVNELITVDGQGIVSNAVSNDKFMIHATKHVVAFCDKIASVLQI